MHDMKMICKGMRSQMVLQRMGMFNEERNSPQGLRTLHEDENSPQSMRTFCEDPNGRKECEDKNAE